ncbi:hypothetical protein FPQ18DRAFT_378839 [Pyronema domesticum]|uniref:Uncharacterized protein n=1 Tax=Pyronema omphalodes (strain CBS 100304) TaxID=1076935 RepID=U4LQB9_PYROM|nr:hypothetical protein FPQ18DRAFT_378839 [Pyronema domesticum]CCX33764.1 Protein of unknown function [Pyronema omphalodes CBS 100304]
MSSRYSHQNRALVHHSANPSRTRRDDAAAYPPRKDALVVYGSGPVSSDREHKPSGRSRPRADDFFVQYPPAASDNGERSMMPYQGSGPIETVRASQAPRYQPHHRDDRYDVDDDDYEAPELYFGDKLMIPPTRTINKKEYGRHETLAPSVENRSSGWRRARPCSPHPGFVSHEMNGVARYDPNQHEQHEQRRSPSPEYRGYEEERQLDGRYDRNN